jgi:hypothetical protein
VSDRGRLANTPPYIKKPWASCDFGVPCRGKDSSASSVYNRERVLAEARELIDGDRDKDYGPAYVNHDRIARIWEVILGIPIEPSQVALCMAGVKMARLVHTLDKADSWVDLAAYAALGAEMIGAE